MRVLNWGQGLIPLERGRQGIREDNDTIHVQVFCSCAYVLFSKAQLLNQRDSCQVEGALKITILFRITVLTGVPILDRFIYHSFIPYLTVLRCGIQPYLPGLDLHG